MNDTEEREEYVAGLRHLANTLEKHHWLPLPHDGTTGAISIFYFDLPSNKDAKIELSAARRVLGGTWEKEGDESYFRLRRNHGLKLVLATFREQVCEKRVVGTKKVQKAVYDYSPSRYEEVDEEIVEWVCPPSLSGAE